MSETSLNRRDFLQGTGAAAMVMTGNALSSEIVAAGTTTVRELIPSGACDCHLHVFEPAEFPYSLPRTYTPGEATLDALLALQKKLGVDRMVLVQPSTYGTDNRCLLSALERLGTARSRGIAVIDPATADRTELQRWHAKGIRGVRLNMEVKGEHNKVAIAALLKRTAELVAPMKWCIQLYIDVAMVSLLAEDLVRLPCPVILDHFGGLKAKNGLQQPGVAVLKGLLQSGNVYVKLSAPYRVSDSAPDFADVTPFARALIDANPHRLLWGTDWPHTGSSGQRSGDLSVIEPFRQEDDVRTLGLLAQWAPDVAVRRAILADNAATLFGFTA